MRWIRSVFGGGAPSASDGAEPEETEAEKPLPGPPDPPAGLRPDLVIPCHNDAAGLMRLLDRARRLRCFAQIIVVDDGSDPPLSDQLESAPDLTILRHDVSRGGGVARNHGLDAVTAPHVLFFDADDLLLGELPLLLAELAEAGPFDFCQFRYADSRVTEEGRWGQPDWDDVFWQTSSAVVGTLADLEREHWPMLAQTANYPWNKIYDTAFLKANGIGCAATSVHQDIPLHWLGYLDAQRVLVSDRICGWHEVRLRGRRLTNRGGVERLEVFDALDPVARRIAADPTPDWAGALAKFALGLVDWGADRIEPDLLPQLRQREAEWLQARIQPWHEAIRDRDPDLAAQIMGRAS